MRTLMFATMFSVALSSAAYAGGYDPPAEAARPKATASAGASARAHLSTAQLNRQSLRAAQVLNQSYSPTVNVNVSGRGNGTHGSGGSGGGAVPVIGDASVRQAPDVLLPSIGGGGSDCPVVGFGVGGSGLSGGGGFGPSWISTHCDSRKLAELLISLGRRDLAMQVLADEYPVVRAGLDQH